MKWTPRDRVQAIDCGTEGGALRSARQTEIKDFMDIATIAGILIGGLMVFMTVFHAEGLKGFAPFINAEAFFIVAGGTFCAMSRQLSHLAGARPVPRAEEGHEQRDHRYPGNRLDVREVRQEGPHGWISGPSGRREGNQGRILQAGVQLVIDGADKEFIQSMMETELGFVRERHKVGQEIFNSLGTYSPAFGIIGTILGMILMMNSLDDIAQVPRRWPRLSAAFFGLGSGYLLFLPMAGKLRRRSEEELLIKEIVIRGVLLLQTGAAPSLIESNLKAYLDPTTRSLIRSTAEAA